MNLPRPKHTLSEYMAQYASEHTHLGTKLTHMVGIPMILASFPTAVVSPPLAGGLFVGGWALQYIGHYVFEKNDPAFYSDPYYLLVGPVWVGAEWAKLLRPAFATSHRGRAPFGQRAPRQNGEWRSGRCGQLSI